MDQDAMVNDRLESGGRLVDELRAAGFNVAAAFWAKPSDEEKWYLYLASPMADRQGQEAYRIVYTAIRRLSELGIDPFEVRVIGLDDAMAKAASAVTKPNAPDSPFAVKSPKPYPGATRFGGSSLGGVGVDGAYIYTLLQAAASV